MQNGAVFVCGSYNCGQPFDAIHIAVTMSEEQFTNWSMGILLTGLIIFMGFIIWDLGKKSGAGKTGMIALFVVLGFGVMGFVFKNLLVEFLLMK